MFRPRRRHVPRSVVAGVAALAMAVGACSSDDVAIPETTVVSTTTTTVPPRGGDDRLVIGVLLPRTGVGSSFGSPLINAVRLAVDRINDAGGVIGEPVRLVEVDEGGTVDSAALALGDLVTRDVDAVVGPASSLAALGALDIAVSAGVLTCSPTATALGLDAFPDEGLFFRTVPSDSLQAVAIAEAAELTGEPAVSIFYLDDAYGRGLADAVESAIESRNLTLRDRVGFSPGESDLGPFARDVVAEEPGVIIVLGDADAGTRMLSALGDAVGSTVPNRVLVNDALRTARSSQSIVDLPDDLRDVIRGVAPLSTLPDDDDFAGAFAAHAYDCVNLIALAAEQAGTDAPARVATQIAAVSVGGSVCRSFADCVDRLGRGLQIAYNGPMGELQLSTRGDPTRGRFEVFRFDEGGLDVLADAALIEAAT